MHRLSTGPKVIHSPHGYPQDIPEVIHI